MEYRLYRYKFELIKVIVLILILPGGLGKRAWNSNFSGGLGKRAWNSGFTGTYNVTFTTFDLQFIFSKVVLENKS